jgi:hypothetical protein
MFAALSNVSTAFTAYPTPMLGTNYCLMARAASTAYPDWYSQFAIVGTATNTTVWITPSGTAKLYDNHTNAYSIQLNQGDTYQINSSEDGVSDVTGTWIASDKPIAVFAGVNEADVPDHGTAAENPLLQEQLPVEDWGTNVVAMSFAGRTNGDSYRILTAESNTVTITGMIITNVIENYPPWTVMTNYETVTTNLAAGGFCDIIVDGPAWFQSTKPIQVAQFGNGDWFDYIFPEPNREYPEGDPCEILLSPTGQWMNSYVIYASTNDGVTGDFDENYLNLIVPQSATNTTLVDRLTVASTNFVAVGASGYYAAQLTMTNSGAHTVTSSQPIEVQVYGWGSSDAYGYFGGVVK